MFRKIDIDFDDDDDEELKDLKCEGVESMLIDWQGGFLGDSLYTLSNKSAKSKILQSTHGKSRLD